MSFESFKTAFLRWMNIIPSEAYEAEMAAAREVEKLEAQLIETRVAEVIGNPWNYAGPGPFAGQTLDWQAPALVTKATVVNPAMVTNGSMLVAHPAPYASVPAVPVAITVTFPSPPTSVPDGPPLVPVPHYYSAGMGSVQIVASDVDAAHAETPPT